MAVSGRQPRGFAAQALRMPSIQVAGDWALEAASRGWPPSIPLSCFLAHSLGMRAFAVSRRRLSISTTQSPIMARSSGDTACCAQMCSKSTTLDFQERQATVYAVMLAW
jgi:hypothetical protein